MPNYSILHFGSHGIFDRRNPRASGLIMSGGKVLSISRLLEEKALFNSARLVVLSACESGLSDISYVPDEFIGLPAAFLQAGAQNVISSLWLVDDTATALLMAKFYDNLFSRKMSIATALNRAQHWLRSSTTNDFLIFIESKSALASGYPSRIKDLKTAIPKNPGAPYRHPYYWAGFVLTGI